MSIGNPEPTTSETPETDPVMVDADNTNPDNVRPAEPKCQHR